MADEMPPPGARLLALAKMVPAGSRLVDIGCDHGRLAAWLLATGRASSCIATEVEATRLEGVRARYRGHPWSHALTLRAGDGLDAIVPADGIEVAVIAGLGGRAIARILSAAATSDLGLSRLVLQAQTETPELRRFLVDREFRFVDERIARERGRSYELMAVVPGRESLEHESLSPEDVLAAGPFLVRTKSPAAAALWRERLDYYEGLSKGEARGPGLTAAKRGAARARRIVEALARP